MIENDCEKKILEMEEEIKRLNLLIKEKDLIINKTKEYLFVLEYELKNKNK